MPSRCASDIVAAGSSYVCRVRDRTNLNHVVEERPISAAARQAGVLSDQVLQLGSSQQRSAKPNHPVRMINLVASNIPGPQMPMYLGGTRLVAYYPLLPLGANAALSIAVISMSGVMGVGLTADWAGFPDVDQLSADVDESFTELKKAAGI